MRRRELIVLLYGAATGWSFAARGQQAEVEKLSKAQAQYQDSPRGIAMCATCTLFVAPRACKAVDGDISPNGWCKEYAMADLGWGHRSSDRYFAKAVFREVA